MLSYIRDKIGEYYFQHFFKLAQIKKITIEAGNSICEHYTSERSSSCDYLKDTFSRKNMIQLAKILNKEKPTDYEKCIRQYLVVTKDLKNLAADEAAVMAKRFYECVVGGYEAYEPVIAISLRIKAKEEGNTEKDKEIESRLKEIEKQLHSIFRAILEKEDYCLKTLSPEYVNRCCIVNDNQDDEEKRFHNYPHSINDVVRMLCRNRLVTDEEFIGARDLLYEETLSTNVPVYFAANSGCGKTVLLGAVALKAIIEGKNVLYFSPSQKRLLPAITKTTIVLIDDAYSHYEEIVYMHKKYSTNPSVHFVFADQPYRLNQLIEELEESEDGIKKWVWSSKGVILTRSSKQIELRLGEEKKRIFALSDAHIKSVAIRAICSSFSNDVDLEGDFEKLECTNKSITDVISDFYISYNERSTATSMPLPKRKRDWEAWENIPGFAGSFRFIAALCSCGIPVSVRFLNKLLNNKAYLLLLDDKGVLPFSFSGNGSLRLTHDSVAEQFFYLTRESQFDTLCQMIEDEMLDDKTVLKFVHVIFSKHFISNPPAFLRKNNRIVELLRLFERKERYIQILNQERQIHEFEIARIRIESRENKDIFRDRVGKLFNRIVNSDSYRTANKEQLWIGFFKLIRGEGCGIPIELLEYIAKTEDKWFYKKITQYIDRIVKMFDFSHFVEISEDHYEYYEEILLWIIEKMDQEDLASRYVLFRLYSKTRQFDKGIKCSEEIIQRESPETAYIGAIREMGILDRMAKAICDETTPGSKNQITEINRRINEIYRRATSNIPVGASDYLEQYCALTNEYARIQINKKSFDVAFKALTQTINIVEEKEEKSEKMARLFLTMGTLCQRRKGRNPFFQNTSAKKWFEKALDCCVNDKERIYVLKPLSKTLLDLGEYEEVKRCCYMMRKLSKHDKEIKVIYVEACRLQDIKTNGFAEAVLPERIPLETATKEEVIDCLCQMYVAMTDKQMQYAKNYWSSLDSFEERIQRASKAQLCQLVSCLYHILNNTLIPPQTLSIIWKFKC